MHKALRTTALAGLIAASLPAAAATIDFESLVRGTVVTTELWSQGVLVSGINSSGCCQPGLVLDNVAGDLGVLPFGGSGRQGLVYGIPGDQLTFNFVLPNTLTATTWSTVSLRVGDGDGASESFRVTFKGLGGNVLSAQQFTTTSGSVDGGATVSFSGGGVASVEILGIPGGSGGGVDDLSFSSPVPEPRAYAMVATGLLLVGWQLRRRSRARRLA